MGHWYIHSASASIDRGKKTTTESAGNSRDANRLIRQSRRETSQLTSTASCAVARRRFDRYHRPDS